MDITQLILDDHHEQRRLFAMLEQIDRSDVTSLMAMWSRLSIFLELHASAEEKLFYPVLLGIGKGADETSVTEETEDAIKDHNQIRDAITAVAKHPVGSDAWLEAVAQVNHVNSDHMGEEERQGLTDVRRHAGLGERHRLAVAFATFEAVHAEGVKPVDQDPKAYVERITGRPVTPTTTLRSNENRTMKEKPLNDRGGITVDAQR